MEMLGKRRVDQYEGVANPNRHVKSCEGEHVDAHIKRLCAFAGVDFPLRDPGTTSHLRHDVYHGTLRMQISGPCRW